jgi:hypothetical protein
MGLKPTDFMGAIPAIGGRMKEEDRGFLFGMLPGLIYKESQKNKKKDSPSKQVAQASNVGQAQASNVGKRMKKGGKVSSSSKSKKKGYKCSHNRLY